MISVPLRIVNCTDSLWAITYDAQNGAWGQWVTTKNLEPDKGYFVYSPEAKNITFLGDPVTINEIKLTAGWNLIPSPKEIDLSKYDLKQETYNNMTGYGWYLTGSDYTLTTKTEPYKAYWVYANSNTTIALQ
jgi:hypothetical protein